jgi:hypothetical protein
MSLQDDIRQFERLKLKLQINSYLHKWGKSYAKQLMRILCCKDLAFYNSVVDEMHAEGLLTKETGGYGAAILVYHDVTQGVDHA